MKRFGSLIAALTVAAIAPRAHAVHEQEVKEPIDSVDANGPSSCSITLDYGDPLPPEQEGLVVCYRNVPHSGAFGKVKPGAYAGYLKDKHGHESDYTSVCGASKLLPGSAPDAWEANWSYGRIYGGQLFGAGAVMSAFLRGEPAAGEPGEEDSHADRMSGGASLKAAATVFHQSLELLDIGAEAEAEYGAEATGHAHAYVLGLANYETSGSIPLNLDVSDTATLLSATMNVALGPVPVQITGSVVGEIGLTGKTGPTIETLGSGIKVEAMPYARLFAEATASTAGSDYVGLGVTGALTLVRAEVPSTAKAIFDSAGAMRWSLDSDLELGTLDGSVVAWLKLLTKHQVTLAEWEGLETTIPLLHIAGCRTFFDTAGG